MSVLSRTGNRRGLFPGQWFLRDEAGGFIAFSMFAAVLILLMAGMAVDLMRYEQQRALQQQTLDTAILAAASVSQKLPAQEVVREYYTSAGLDPDTVNVQIVSETIKGGRATGRAVRATSDFNTSTGFMRMMGVETLGSEVVSAAGEGATLLEIVMVLDVSESMNENDRLAKMKAAAKEFVTTVLANNEAEDVMISIVPYNHQVYAPDALMAELSDQGMLNEWTNSLPGPHRTGSLRSIEARDPDSRCLNFWGEDFSDRQLVPRNYGADVLTKFVDNAFVHTMNGVTNQPHEVPHEFSFWCNDISTRMMLYQNDLTTLTDHIDSIFAHEGTSIDIGMTWAVGLLDPSFRPVVNGLANGNHVPASVRDHPADYDDEDVKKYVILMSDGVNDTSMSMKWPYWANASPMWYSPSEGATNEFDGFYLEMPDNPESTRWYKPGMPGDASDDQYIADSALPGDAEQWSYRKLYRRFTTLDAATYFFEFTGDNDRYTEHVFILDRDWQGGKDDKLNQICEAAKVDREITVFTMSFEAPDAGREPLETCATTIAHHFAVDVTTIEAAFATIASEISLLKLTE